MADQSSSPPEAAAAAAAFAEALMPEAGPTASADFGDPHASSEADAIGAIFGLPPAGSQGGGEGVGGGGAPPPAPAAGAAGGDQTQGVPTPPQGSPPASSPSGEGQPQSPTLQGQPAPPVAPAPSPAPAQAPATPAPPQTPAVPDAAALELASLRAQVAQLQQALKGQQPTAPQTGQQPQPQGQPQAEQAPQYGLQVPQQHLQMIQGDDPAAAGVAISDLLNQTASHVHQRVLADVRSMVQSELQRFHGSLQSEQTTDQAVRDYYQHFPDHKLPAVQAIVAQEAAKLQSEYPGLGYSEQFRNALGARVNQVLASLGAQPAAPTPAPAQPGGDQQRVITPPVPGLPQQPAPALPGSPRPALGGTSPGDFMWETFMGTEG